MAFRHAPNQLIFGENTKVTQVDPNGYLVMVTFDDSENWTKEPELIFAHPIGRSQDPCLLRLRG